MVTDDQVRTAAFAWLTEQVVLHGTDVLPWSVLSKGFILDSIRVPLVNPQGIFKPRLMSETPLSIMTSLKSPYDDSVTPDNLINYAYRGTDPRHPDNVRLRHAMQIQAPLVYLKGIIKGHYLVAWPVFVVGDDPVHLRFTMALDEPRFAHPKLTGENMAHAAMDDMQGVRRQYMTALLRRRVHQRSFRERVLRAYHDTCSFCHLKHRELLDAAHIIPDAEPRGEPVVQNGLALCKLHHAAYDRSFLAVRPDYVIEIRQDIMDEEDGPMLLHGLKGMHLKQIALPRATSLRPDPDRLQKRYAEFRLAGNPSR